MSRREHKNRKKSRLRPVWMICFMHLMALGVALVTYALAHHVIPRADEAIGTMSTRAMVSGEIQAMPSQAVSEPGEVAETPEPEPLVWELDLDEDDPEAENDEAAEVMAADGIEPEILTIGTENLSAAVAPADLSGTAEMSASAVPSMEPEVTTEPTPEPTEEPKDEVGSFRIKFADKFTSGKVKRTKNTYQSKNLNVRIKKVRSEEWDTVFYVVDIYVADISCFMTAFAQDKFGMGYTAWPREIAEKYKSVITMNGDYYGMRKSGVVIRNGKLYKNKKVSRDVCVLYWDGTMKTFSPGEFNADNEMARGAYQAWNFGPRLLDEDGKAKTKFNSEVTDKNPRSVVGYFEPGHYCFVVVDGRNDESDGLSMKNLAELMERLGCKQAYNLDGGRTSMLYAGDTRINKPVEGGRKSSDVLMIVDRVSK